MPFHYVVNMNYIHRESLRSIFINMFQESVNDLMATIAKLDRNGIEVVPETSKGAGGDTLLADSSTGLDETSGPSALQGGHLLGQGNITPLPLQ